MDVHVRELRSFLAVAEHLNFTRAAEAAHLTQPALSKQIAALERQLGVRLFDRDRRSVALTSSGSTFLPAAGAVVAAWDAARDELARAATGRLTIGLQTSPGRGLLPAVRARLAAECPEVALVLRQVGWADATAGLTDGSCDAAFLWLPLPDRHALSSLTIVSEQRSILLAADHPLAARASVRMADLVDEPFLALPTASARARDFWLATEQRGGREPIVVGEIATTEEAYESVAAGIGVCLMAAGNAPIFERSGVAMRPVVDVPPAELVLAWRRGEHSGLLAHFAHACEAVASGIGHDGRDAASLPQEHENPPGEGRASA